MGITIEEKIPHIDFKDKEYELSMHGGPYVFVPYIIMKIEGDEECYNTGITVEWLNDMRMKMREEGK